MEMNEELDELFKSKLGDGEAPVPETSWEQISTKISTGSGSKSRRVLIPMPFYWLAASFIGGLLAGIFTFYVWNLKNENTQLKALLVQKSQQDDLTKNKRVNNLPPNSYLKKQNSINEITNEENFNDKQLEAIKLHKSNNVEQKGSNLALKQIGPDKDISGKHSTSKRKYSGQGSINNVAESNLAVKFSADYDVLNDLNGNNIKRNKNGARSKLYNNYLSPRNNRFSQNLDSVKVVSGDKVVNKKEVENTLENTIVPESFIKSYHTAATDSVKALLPKQDSLIENSKTEKNVGKVKDEPQEKKKVLRMAGFPISIGMYLTPEIASRSINFTNNTDPQIIQYKQSEKIKFGFSAGLSLDIHLPKNFFIRSGLNYWNVGDKNNVRLTHKDTTVSTVFVKSDTTNISQSNISSSFMPGPVKTTEIRESFSQFSSVISNNYHYLGIPLLLGKKLNNNRLNFGLFSGIITNVLLSPNNTIYYIYYNAENSGKFVESRRELAKFSLVYSGGIDVGYSLANNWMINISPAVKYSLTSVYRSGTGSKELPYSIGIQVGVKYMPGY